MNTVRRFVDPHNPWWRFIVHHAATGQSYCRANAQSAADLIADSFPGEAFHWDTRENPE